MAIPLPPDPYKALGVESTAPEGDIRKVYLKLVLKCHPDKIQDPILRAQKIDEFHRIQEAWDILSDKAKREDYDEKVRMNARSSARRGSAGTTRQTRSGGYTQPAPAGYNVYEAANANIYTAEPRERDSRRRREPSPVRVYTQHQTRSYEDDMPSRYEDAPRMRKTASAEHSSRKPAGATMDRERNRRVDEDRERERYEKDRKKKEYSSSQKSRDREKRSRTEEKTSRKAFIVDDSPEEYEPRRTSKKVRGGDVLLNEFDRMNISSSKYPDPKHDEALQYISASRSKARTVPLVPSAPPAVRHEEFRPRPMQRAETFSTYPAPQPSRPYFADDDEVIHRSSARGPSRRPSADAATPRSSDPNSPHIITAEPPFARKPQLQHHNSAPPIFTDRMPTRAQTMNEAPRRPSVNTVPNMPPRAQTFNDKYSSPLKQSYAAHYSSDSSSSDSDAGPYASRRPAPVKRPSATKVYKVESRGGTKFTTVVEEEQPVFVRRRSSSPRRSSDRPSASRTTSSSVRSKGSSAQSSRYYDERPTGSVRREVPGVSKTGGGSYFGEQVPGVKYAQYDDVQYSHYDPKGSANIPSHAYHSTNRRGEAVN